MLERELLRIAARSPRYYRSLAHRLQRTTPAPIARPANAECVRCHPTRFAYCPPLITVALDGATSRPRQSSVLRLKARRRAASALRSASCVQIAAHPAPVQGVESAG